MYSTLNSEDPLYARGARQPQEPQQPESNDLTLGMPALLGIFFAIVIICGLAFGYGYSVGHHPKPVTTTVTQAPAPAPMPAVAAPPLETAPQPVGTAPGPEVSGTPKPSPAAAPVVEEAQPAELTPAPTTALASTISATPVMVQIAAVVHANDAEALAAALRHDGYNAVVRTAPQDHFLHVQIGPFPTRDAARAMRARLQAAGYSPILKP